MRKVEEINTTRNRTVAEHVFGGDLAQKIIALWMWGWIAYSGAQSVGRFNAMHQQEFLVPSSSRDSVVLCAFGDSMIVAPFDRKSKEVTRSFSLVKKGEDSRLLLSWEIVGPLRLKELAIPSALPPIAPLPNPPPTQTPTPPPARNPQPVTPTPNNPAGNKP